VVWCGVVWCGVVWCVGFSFMCVDIAMKYVRRIHKFMTIGVVWMEVGGWVSPLSPQPQRSEHEEARIE
jgi:hypothetical protein